MTGPGLIDQHKRIPLTRFHNNTAEFLDLSTKAPIILTRHGQERHIIADIGYFRHLEAIASGRMADLMDIKAVRASEMSDKDYAIFEVSKPSPEELANDKWADKPS